MKQNSPTDTVSSLSWSPNSNLLVAGSWNNEVRCWDVNSNGKAVAKAMMKHNAPVLCTSFAPDNRVFSGSCDHTAKMWNLQTQQQAQVAQHAAPIKACSWIPEVNLLATGSWDKTLKYWDTRSSGAQVTINLSERLFCMDIIHPLVVLGTADRKIQIYDLRNPKTPYKDMISPLKFQSRCIAAFPDKTGFALGSIEGRVAISHVSEQDKGKNFAFKCHRHGSDVFSVNSIAFHPYGTFATCGSDGAYRFWDKDSKQRLKLFHRADNAITASKFNRDGTIFAYALGYDWSKGIQHWDKSKPNGILLHGVQEKEVKPGRK